MALSEQYLKSIIDVVIFHCLLLVVLNSTMSSGVDISSISSSLRVLITTLSFVAVVVLVVKLLQMVRQRFAFEKSLSVFPEAPDRHWFWGHLQKVLLREVNDWIWICCSANVKNQCYASCDFFHLNNARTRRGEQCTNPKGECILCSGSSTVTIGSLCSYILMSVWISSNVRATLLKIFYGMLTWRKWPTSSSYLLSY